MKLADILKDSNYRLSQFTTAEIEQLEQSITLKLTKSGEVPYIICLVRQKAIKLTPEEAIRQLYLGVLVDRLHYPVSHIQVEYGVNHLNLFSEKLEVKLKIPIKSESNLNNY